MTNLTITKTRFRASVAMAKQKRFNNAVSNCCYVNNGGTTEPAIYFINIFFVAIWSIGFIVGFL